MFYDSKWLCLVPATKIYEFLRPRECISFERKVVKITTITVIDSAVDLKLFCYTKLLQNWYCLKDDLNNKLHVISQR